MSWRLLALLIRLGVGLLLFYATLSLAVAIVRTPEFQQLFVALGILLGGLWALYKKLPDWLQEALRLLWKRKEGGGD